MTITPYVEQPVIRTTTQPVSSGIDTRAVDHLREGNEIRSDQDRARVLRATMRGIDSGPYDNITFGQPSPFDRSQPYVDFGHSFNQPLTYMSSSKRVFPEEIDSSNYRNADRSDGFIEPFRISDRKLKYITSSNDQIRWDNTVKGSYQNAGQTRDGRSFMISQFIEIKPPVVAEQFFDSQDVLAGNISKNYQVSGVTGSIHPFSDIEQTRKNSIVKDRGTGSTLTGQDMISAILDMNPTDYDMRPAGTISSTSGWTYDNNFDGTDSLTYGGKFNA